MQQTLKQWATAHNLSTIDGTHWYHRTALVVMADNKLRRCRERSSRHLEF